MKSFDCLRFRLIKDSSKWRRILIICIGCVLVLTTSGTFFGWTALLLVLKREHVYSYLCDEGAGGGSSAAVDCDEQDVRFGLIYTIGVVSFLFSPLPSGALLDRLGPRRMIAVCSFLLALALVLLGFSQPPSFDSYGAAFFVYNFANISAYFSLIHLARLYPSRQHTVVINSQASAFSSSLFFFVYLLIPVSLFVFSIIWPEEKENSRNDDESEELRLSAMLKVEREKVASAVANDDDGGEPTSPATSPRSSPDAAVSPRRLPNPLRRQSSSSRLNAGKVLQLTKSRRHVIFNENQRLRREQEAHERAKQANRRRSSSQGEASMTVVELAADSDPTLSRSITYRLARESLWTQLKSVPFALFTIYGTVGIFFSNLYIGTAELRLQSVTNDDADTRALLARILSFVLPSSFILAPAIGWLLDKKGLLVGFAITQTLAIGWSLSNFLPSPWAHIVVFILYSSYRAVFYSTYLALIVQVFGFATFGRLYGLMLLIVGLVSFLTFLIIDVVVRNGNSWQTVNIVQLACFIASSSILLYWRANSKRWQD